MQFSRESGRNGLCEEGTQPVPHPSPKRGKWVQAKEIVDISGLTARHRLVCAAAGRMQADPECQKGIERSAGGEPSAAPA